MILSSSITSQRWGTGSCQWRNAGAAVKHTVVLVKAPGAKDAKVENQTGCVPTGAVMPCCLMPLNIGKQSSAGYQYPG